MVNEQIRINPPKLDLGEAVALGWVAGAARRSKIGYTSVTGTSTVDIWNVGGVYTPLAAEQALEVVSTDNTNDKANGTGALTVRIGYLTSTFVSKTTDVTLTGTVVAATTATDIMYVNSFRVLTAGTGGAAAGTLTLRRSSVGTSVSQIAIGQTRGRKMYYTVPAGKKLLIKCVTWAVGAASSAGKDFVRFTLRAYFDELLQVKSTVEYPFFESGTLTGGGEESFEVPLTLPEGVTVRMVAAGNSATDAALAYTSWDAMLVDA